MESHFRGGLVYSTTKAKTRGKFSRSLHQPFQWKGHGRWKLERCFHAWRLYTHTCVGPTGLVRSTDSPLPTLRYGGLNFDRCQYARVCFEVVADELGKESRVKCRSLKSSWSAFVQFIGLATNSLHPNQRRYWAHSITTQLGFIPDCNVDPKKRTRSAR